jgi:hypothetical protein
MIKMIISLLLFVFITTGECSMPRAFYANIGDSVRLQCSGLNGAMGCFSTYTFEDQMHPMVAIPNSRKYQISQGAIIINSVRATDAGFYACAADCSQMTSDRISYFLQPMQGGQPVDTSRNWVAIPPFTPPGSDGLAQNTPGLMVAVTNEFPVGRGKRLSNNLKSLFFF